MKLIETKQAKEFASTFLADKILQAAVNAVLDNAPGFELVRCKDCKWYKESKLMPPIKFCYRLIGNDGKPVGYNFSDDDFCSRGERRTDGN